MQGQVSAAVFRPPQWNFARVCIWCGVRFCGSPECAARHEQTWWAVCEVCCGDLDVVECVCTFGVVELDSREQAERQARRYGGEYRQAVAGSSGPLLRAVA